ncbi:MAG: hypothetical protein U0133_06540 [Gemmatimonadales bacterium]
MPAIARPGAPPRLLEEDQRPRQRWADAHRRDGAIVAGALPGAVELPEQPPEQRGTTRRAEQPEQRTLWTWIAPGGT